MAEQIMQETAGKAIPAGYKQTEVGVIPEDWKVKSGEEITVLIGKGASPRWQGFSYTSDGMLFVTSENVRDGYLDISEPKYLPLEFHEKLKRSQLHVGDILINLVGASIGRSCYIDIELGEANINQAVSVFRLSDEYNARFISCYFSSSICIGRILDMQVDAARPNISLGDLRRFLIPLPPSAEQTAIANVLSDSDALIDALEQLIAKKQAIKTATMQQLLTGRTRLPQFALRSDGTPKGYKSSELGQIPEDWKVLPLGELCHFENGDRSSNYPSSDEFVSFGIPFINAGHIDNGVIDSKGMDYISAVIYARLGGGKVKPGDLVYCLRGSLGKFGVVPDDFGMGAIASSLVIVRPITSRTSCEFISEYFKSDISKRMVSLWAGGAAQPNLGAKELANFLVPLPNNLEQTAIATILSDMDSELNALEQKLAKARDVKQGMMQQLLTGRIRLPLPQEA